jgi:transposase
MTQDALVVGVDVGKDFLDVAFGPSGETWRVANDAEGRAALVRRLARLKLAVVAFEASGGYERPLLSALCRVGLPAARLNSFRVRKFGEALGIMAKNDRIDAGLIARFAATLPPRQTTTPDPAHEQLRELALVRRQLVDDRSRLQNQEEQTQNEMLQRFCRRRQATLAAQIVLIDKAIAQMIAEDADLARKDARLRSVPGIGPTVAATLLALMPELGQITGKQVASLVGVAPFDHESGRYKGKRVIAGGRTPVRRALYMAALVAARHNPVLRQAYERLIKAGKPKKLALTALMRRLITILNAMLRNGEDWRDLAKAIA